MRIAVFGSGGVGGYFGGRLAQAGEDVTFIARGPHLQALQEHGLRVESILGDFDFRPVQATSQPAEVGPVEVVLLGVKAWQVPEAGEAIRPLIGSDTCVVPLQNGVDAPAQLTALLGDQHVLGGMCRISALVAAPGVIRHAGIEPFVAFGELNGQVTARVERLQAAFQRAGVKVAVPADIQAAIWEKFVFIAAVSGMGAATRAPLGPIRDLPASRQMLFQALQEVVAVGRANGVALDPDTAQKVLAMIDTMPASVTASMQRDIMDGHPSELEAQNGAVVRLGQKTGTPTPIHASLYALLLPQEQRARSQISF